MARSSRSGLGAALSSMMVNNLMINYCSGLSAARGLMMTGSMISFGPGSGTTRGSSFFSSDSGEVGRVSMGS